nr:MAG TPA: tail protein [Bacteriophage sp.]
MMVRDVNLKRYIPQFMQKYNELTETLDVENSEFLLIWQAADKILHNQFISTADEYGIRQYEKILGIFSDSSYTLEMRRKRVQNRWFNSLPYTIKTLTMKLVTILNEHNFIIRGDFKTSYELFLTVYTLDDSQDEELKYVLSTIVPVNVAINIVYESAISGAVFSGGIMCESDIIKIKQRKV